MSIVGNQAEWAVPKLRYVRSKESFCGRATGSTLNVSRSSLDLQVVT